MHRPKTYRRKSRKASKRSTKRRVGGIRTNFKRLSSRLTGGRPDIGNFRPWN